MNYYDKEEEELVKSFNKGEWTSSKEDHTIYQKLADEHLKKSMRINIRISAKDLKDIKRLAALEGLPYQTFISSILHKYANNRLS